jgi:hypothetical protein
MHHFPHAIGHRMVNTLSAGLAASLLSMVGLAIRGRAEAGSAAAPFNAISHWLYGRRVLRLDTADLRHTMLGAAVHTRSSIFWAALYDRLVCRREPSPRPVALVAGAAGVSALAAVTDFSLLPERLTPGFEHRLCRRSLLLTYVLFGTGLALGALAARRQR